MKFKDALQKLSFSPNEALIYEALFENEYLTATEISKATKITRTKVYVVLDRLKKQNYVEEIKSSPAKFTILNPNNLFLEVEDIAKTLFNKSLHYGKSDNNFEIVSGREAIINWLQDKHPFLRKYSNSCTILDRDFPATIFRKFKRITKKGVKFRFLTLFEEENIPIYKKWIAAGVKVRIFEEEKFGHALPRISTMDDKWFRLTIGKPDVPSDDLYVSFVGENETLAKTLDGYFKDLWKKSTPVEDLI